MGGCCRPTTRFGACLCALIRSIPYISLAGFGCMVMGFLLITANLVPLFDFIRDHILDPEQSNSYSRRVMNGAYTYYWIVTFIALSGCLFSLFLSLFGTGWIHEQCCGIKTSLGKGPSVCLNFVSSTFMVLQAIMVIFFFLLTLLAVLSFTLSVVFAGSREGVRNICNIRPVKIYNRAANITVCTQVYEEYYRINATDTHTPTEGSITPNITRLDKQLQDETYYNSTCINLKQYNQDLVDIKCGAPYDKFCASATTTKLRTAAGALVAGTSFFLMSCLLFLASTPANYVRFRQLPEYRILNTNDGGGRRGGAGAQRLEDEEEDWSEDVDDEEDVSPKGRGRGGRAGGRRGGTGGRGRRQQAGGQFSVQDDDDLEMDDEHGHGAVAVNTLPPGAHAVVVAAAEVETARLRRAREALEAEAEAVRKRRQERELEDERERTAERERRRVREEAESNERMDRMRRQLDEEKRQLEAQRAALRQQQATVQSSVASQAQAQQQATLNKAAGSTESTTYTTTSPDNSVSAM